MLDHRGFKGRRRLLGEQRGTYDDVHMLLNITLFIVIDKKLVVCARLFRSELAGRFKPLVWCLTFYRHVDFICLGVWVGYSLGTLAILSS